LLFDSYPADIFEDVLIGQF